MIVISSGILMTSRIATNVHSRGEGRSIGRDGWLWSLEDVAISMHKWTKWQWLSLRVDLVAACDDHLVGSRTDPTLNYCTKFIM